MTDIARRGVCLVLSAPSGAGKTAIADALVASEPLLERSISVTTRARRPAEIDGIHYHFLTEERFQQALFDQYRRPPVFGRLLIRIRPTQQITIFPRTRRDLQTEREAAGIEPGR